MFERNKTIKKFRIIKEEFFKRNIKKIGFKQNNF